MAQDPDELLIFKARGMAKKKEGPEASLPKEEREKFLPRQIFAQPKAAAEPQPEPKAEISKPPERQQPPKPEKPKTNFSSLSMEKNVAQAAGIAEAARKRKAMNPEEKKNLYAEDVIRKTLGNSESATISTEELADQQRQAKDAGQHSKDEAKGYYCAWHPWRNAYAVCAYCHRPFCFQDIVELNGLYYCLEDIDTVSHTYRERITIANNSVMIAAGVFMIFAFLVFFYYTSTQVLFILAYINRVGIIYFVTNATAGDLYTLVEVIIMAFAFLTSLMLFFQSRKAFYSGMFTCLATITLFSNAYITDRSLYFLVIDGLMFVVFLLLLYSKATRSVAEVENQLVNPSYSQVEKGDTSKFPNVGRF